MRTVIEILAIACFAVLFAQESGVMQWIKYKWVWYRHSGIYKPIWEPRLKPFDCPLCFAWWLGISYGLFHHYGFAESILFGAICSITAIIISKYLQK